MSWPLDAIDIAWLDVGAILCAIAFPLSRYMRCVIRRKPSPHLLDLFLDLLRGATFYPFLLLGVGSFSGAVLEALRDSNRPILFLAAVIGGTAVFQSDKWLKQHIKKLERE